VTPLLSLGIAGGNQQPAATVSNGQVQAAQVTPVPLVGTLSLSFNPNAAGLTTPYTNPGVCFSTTTCTTPPQTSASFTIPAGSASVAIPALQTGTVAGDIVLTLNAPGQATTTTTLTVPRSAPVIEPNGVQIIDVTSTGFVVEVTGYSTPRDMQTASFTFNAASGTQINGSTFTVDVSSAMSQWFTGTQSQAYGSAFSLQIPFTLSGSASAIQSVTVTLTNSAGTSAPATGTP
jgi:hypothetical protein